MSEEDASQSTQINPSYKRPTAAELSKLNKAPLLDAALDLLKELDSIKAADVAKDKPLLYLY